MGELANQLERISVRTRSPDGRIHARVRGRLDLDLEFAPRAYRTYDEATLSHQLSQLATLTWTRYRREYVAVENAFLGWPIPDTDARDRLFEQQAGQLIVDGSSATGLVKVRSRALTRWKFHLVPGILRRLAEPDFVSEALAAASDTIRAYRASRVRLLDSCYDLADGLPPWRRDRSGNPGAAIKGKP